MKPPSDPGQSEPLSSTPSVALGRRAAEYVRMSTEAQQYSIARQQAVIREYAASHGYTIVRTYMDAARSGLRLKGRDGLIQLLDDVQHGSPDFDTILVYDVSRWGRFQDTDESAYYEFACRRAGFRVEYCVELFRNDGSLWSAILKNLKRAVAAEYSRERSLYVRRSISMAAARGHFPGGSPMYGMRRVLLQSGRKPRVLNVGQSRALRTDPVVLAPGPADEVRTVRRVFRLFVKKQMTQTAIATLLNKEGVVNRLGRPWNCGGISYMLRNEVYVGTQCYNRRSRRGIIDGPLVTSDPQELIRTPGAFAAIVSKRLFEAAQKLLQQRAQPAHTEASLLEHLRYLWRKHGYLSISLIQSYERPDYGWYQRMFGSALKAYEKIGYTQTWRGISDKTLQRQVQPVVVAVRAVIADLIRKRGISVAYEPLHLCVRVGGSLRFSVRAMTWQPSPATRKPRWYMRLIDTSLPKFRVIVRMDKANRRPLDFLVLPPGKVISDHRHFNECRLETLRRFRCQSLEQVADRLLAELN